MELNLKPTHKAVKKYFAALETFRTLGIKHEGAVRSAFADLLKHTASKTDVHLIEEYPLQKDGKRLSIDGALIDDFKLALGYWEAKDSDDDLDAEVKKKFEAGYPRDNIIFQSPDRIVLYQHGQRTYDREIDSAEPLIEALRLFFSFRPPEFEHWKQAVEEFSGKVPDIAEGIKELIDEEKTINKEFITAYTGFASLCRRSINPNLSDDAIEEMLIQHILTIRIFTKIFDNPEFANNNIIAAEIEKVINTLTSHHFSRADFLKRLDPFYTAIEQTAATIDDYSRKQDFLNTVYEKFFQGFSVKVADTHGIVYTPQPIVDFMVNSIEDVLQREFGRSLSDEGVHILDPFVGTGNFIMRIMRQIRKTALKHKYEHELHCNEVMLLPYYIASMNIEHAYYEMTGEYEPFDGICLVDTFELAEPEQMNLFTEENTHRVERQKQAPIFVILGNPPYNAGQVNENDNNKNRKYKVIDQRVKETYGKDSKAQLLRKLNDPYVKAFRWASDRIGKEGIVCFISNNSFIDNISFDGMRKHLCQDYNKLYVIDLKGNIRADSMKDGIPLGEKHTIFGLSAMVGISVSLFIKQEDSSDHELYYTDVNFRATRQEKFKFLDFHKSVSCINWQKLIPDKKHNWFSDILDNDFNSFIPLGSKETKQAQNNIVDSIFYIFSLGVATNRDDWVYDFSFDSLRLKLKKFTTNYNHEVVRYKSEGPFDDLNKIDKFVNNDPSFLKWTDRVKHALTQYKNIRFDEVKCRNSLFRPFTKEYLYFDHLLNQRRYQQHHIFPVPDTEFENRLICTTAIGVSKPFHCLMTNIIPDLHLTGDTQCFPFYTYDEDGTNRRENITDWALAEYRRHYADDTIGKWDIFHYVYGVLHHPEYRERYAANLRIELPRIPYLKDFRGFAEAGKRLAELHVNYEDAVEYPLREVETPDMPLNWRVEKMKLTKDKSALVYNDFLTLADIPVEVYEYRLGNRSALEWIVDQYRVKTDKRSGIVSDPNDPENPEYIVRLIKKVVTVSLETVQTITGLPEFDIT